MLLDREDTKVAKEMARTMAAKAYSSVEKIKKLEFELAILKGSNTSAPTSLQLEAARQEIVDLKTRLVAIQVKYESAEKEIERSISEFRSAAYAKDKELIATYNQVIHFKKVVDKLEPQVLELQSALKTNNILNKEIEELQRVRACLLKENEQLKDFKTFSISPENLLVFTFKSSISEVVGEVGAQAGVASGKEPKDATAENTKAAKSVATE
ncbi:hypothetical protein ACFX11_030288 [Malus domestica]